MRAGGKTHVKTFFEFFINSNPDIATVRLHPQNEEEKQLLEHNTDTAAIESHYHVAVTSRRYFLLKIVDRSEWPYRTDVLVKKMND